METEKLYYQDPYLTAFTARVLSCEKSKSGWAVVLDRTAFYPEGGGQPADHGTLGAVQVTDVHETKGVIFHTCDGPVEIGTQVAGAVDWPRRFDHMQQHSGEHILSGLLCSLYHCDNVGFHLGADTVTIDYNAELTWEQVMAAEKAANEVIWQDTPVDITFPAPDALARLNYRSKKALTGQVRIVAFPGADCCACCGTHVRRAGEVGIIKVLSCQKFREGVRLEILCGSRAYRYLSQVYDQDRAVAQLLSVKPQDTLAAAERQAEELAADAFGAAHAFLMVGGTTSSVQAMILSVVKRGDEIILPRNVHRSVINALVLTGAIPVYVNPQMNDRLGISLGMSVADVKKAIEKHPSAKAVLVNNPTYYGICSNIREIVKLAHAAGMKVLADEAHGTHFYFGENMPVSAMAAGADLASVSMHKSGGSLTQSSFLLCGPSMNAEHVRQIINLTQTTSGSYLLMVSLDISRKNLALHGKEIFRKVVDLTTYAREEINQIGDYYAYGSELINGDTVYDFDTTKLAVNTLDVGLAGIEVYDTLRDFYDIQTEFGDLGNLLAYVSVGDRERDLERLVAALAAATSATRQPSCGRNISRRRWSRGRRRRSTRTRRPCRSMSRSAASVRSSSCAIRPAFRSSRRVSASPATFSIISVTPRKRTVCCSAPRTPR